VDLDREEGERVSKVMAVVPAMDFEPYWKEEVEALRAAYQEVIASHPEAKKKSYRGSS
jgi:hypothetical protein